MLVRNDWTILMMGGGSAEVGELTWPLWCGDFFSASLTYWAKCKWCHLPLLEWEAKLSGHGGFTERVVWLTLKWLWGYFFSISSLLEIFARFYCRWGLGGGMHNATGNKAPSPHLAPGLLPFYLSSDWNPRLCIEALMRCWQISFWPTGNVIFLLNIVSQWISLQEHFPFESERSLLGSRTQAWLHSVLGENGSPKVWKVDPWFITTN